MGFQREEEFISKMLESKGYSIRDGIITSDDFRIFLTPPGFEIESEEVFKLKGDNTVHCGAVILLGGEIRNAFFKLEKEIRDKLRGMIENETGVNNLDFFEANDDGQDFQVSIRAEFHIDKLSEDVFGDAMDRLNIAGGSIEDAINRYFEKLL
ncbi:MAG TPA: hypothetical protein EYG21_07710 [Nitrospinaceae bacterium]|nr:hypothetical protein [Nitrospinaceae bacterium]